MAVWKGCSVELRRLVRLAMVKPQAGRNLLPGHVEIRHVEPPYAWLVPKIASRPFHAGGIPRICGSCMRARMPASHVVLSGHSI
jgi:hypothetical protein